MSVAAEGVNIRRRPLGRTAMGLLVGIGLAGIVVLVAGATMVQVNLRPPILFLAAVMAAGTLAGMSLFQQGATERAVYSLAASWAVVLLTASGWLIPLAEPYRTSRILGEKLAALSAKLRVEPVLLEFQEPGVIYALGRPIATTRDRDGFFAHLTGGRSVLTVALPSEIEVMRSHFGLLVDPVDRVDGFVWSKGKQQRLELAVVREGDNEPATPLLDPNTRRVGLKIEKTLVK
jgi:hypothetical protein